MIIDPGPECDFDILKKKTESIIGGLSKVKLIFINHQDPDVVPNAKRIQNINPNVLTLMTEDTWRLVQFYGLEADNFRAVEKYRDMKAHIITDAGTRLNYTLQFIPTPFCHFRGACMYYDVNRRILFSGDFMGGISTSELYADETHWEGIKAFHQLYFPSREALRHALAQIKRIDPQPLMIAPQHGGILQGEIMDLFIDRIGNLMVGLDIIRGIGDRRSLFIEAANEIARISAREIGSTSIKEVFKVFNPDGSYPAIFTLGSDNTVRDIKGDPVEAIEALMHVIFSFSGGEQKNNLQRRFLTYLENKGLLTLDLSRELKSAQSDEFNLDKINENGA
jgi:glyoxylase-like metal-dependent hydrolase (beta-lactamase superfamily II)